MTDMEIATLVIKVASMACQEDSYVVLGSAVQRCPDLPWQLAAQGLWEEYGAPYYFAVSLIRESGREAA